MLKPQIDTDAINEGSCEALNLAGACSLGMGSSRDAEAYWLRAIEERPDYADAHNNLGFLYCERKRFSEAEAAYQRVLIIRPDHVEAHNNLGKLFVELKRFHEAEAVCWHMLAACPDHAEVCFDTMTSLVWLLCDEARVDDATCLTERLTSLAVYPRRHLRLGLCLVRLGLYEQAEVWLDKALQGLEQLSSERHLAMCEMAVVKYSLEKFSEAVGLEMSAKRGEWSEIAIRGHFAENDPHRDLFCSFEEKWLSDQSVDGKSIVVIEQGGFGDFLQFSRYLGRLKAEGASVIYCNPAQALKDVIRNSGLPITFAPISIEIINESDYFAWVPDLFLRYRNNPFDPSQKEGYLASRCPPGQKVIVSPDNERVSRYKKVGIVWRSDSVTCRHEPFRSMKLDSLAALLEIESVQFYSLQFGELSAEEKAVLERYRVEDLSSCIHSFSDTANILQQLDLLITVDSAPAHLAGACNRPVWVMLAKACDWRWGGGAQRTTPWYASMRLYQQHTLGDWAPVTDEIAAELIAWQW
jgi:Tetratricopeptide repeat